MTDVTAPVNAPVTFAGGDAPPALDVAGDRGDFIAPAPVLADAAPSVVEPVVPAVEVPAVEGLGVAEPAPVVADPAPAAVENPAAEQGEDRVRNKKDFLDRLSAKNRKIAALEAQVAAQKTAPTPVADPATPVVPAQAPVNTELAGLRIQAMQLMLDGKFEQAAEVQEKIEAAVYERARTEISAQASADAVNTVKQAAVDETVEQAASALVADYDILDADSANFDNKTVRMINDASRHYMEDGYTPAEALRAAADEILRLKHPALFAPEPTPVVAAAPAPRSADPVAAVQRAAQQPPVAAGVSTRTAADAPIDIWSLSDKDFSQLTAAQLSQLRGDTV